MDLPQNAFRSDGVGTAEHEEDSHPSLSPRQGTLGDNAWDEVELALGNMTSVYGDPFRSPNQENYRINENKEDQPKLGEDGQSEQDTDDFVPVFQRSDDRDLFQDGVIEENSTEQYSEQPVTTSPTFGNQTELSEVASKTKTLRQKMFDFQEQLLTEFQDRSIKLAEQYVDSYRQQTKDMYERLLGEEKDLYNQQSFAFKEGLKRTIDKFRYTLQQTDSGKNSTLLPSQ